jgi:hypothetical protein
MRVVILALALAQLAVAGTARQACRSACARQLVACAAANQGRTKLRCKRLMLRACRSQGIAVCAPPSTCGEGGLTVEGDLTCFHDLTPDKFLSASAQRPANGRPATLSVGWSTAYETVDDCSVRWVGSLVRIGDLPLRRF